MTTPENFTGSPKNNLKAIRILCLALMIGVFLFAMISLIVNQFNGPFLETTRQYKDIFLSISGILGCICIFIAIKKYQKNIIVSQNAVSLNDKLNNYRTTLVVYMALCEGPALFSIVVFLLIGNLISLVFTAILFGMMLLKFPAAKRMISELQLNWQEQQELE